MAEALSVAFTPTPLPTGAKLVVWASPQVSPGFNFWPRSKMKTIALGAAATTSPIDVLAGYKEVYGGDLIAGQKIFFDVFVISPDGFASTPLRTSIIVS